MSTLMRIHLKQGSAHTAQPLDGFLIVQHPHENVKRQTVKSLIIILWQTTLYIASIIASIASSVGLKPVSDYFF